MSVDASGLVEAIERYAIEKLECMGETLAEEARSNAPVDTGELASSITWSGASGGGGTVTGTVTVNAPYAAFVEHGRGGEGGLIALEVGGETIVVEGVGPAAAEPFFGPACDDWPNIVGGCA